MNLSNFLQNLNICIILPNIDSFESNVLLKLIKNFTYSKTIVPIIKKTSKENSICKCLLKGLSERIEVGSKK